MTKYQLRFYLCALLLPLFLISCGKDDDEDVSPNVARLTAGEWRGAAIYFNGQNVTGDVLEVDKFDITQVTSKFERDGTYRETYGTSEYAGEWEYQNDDRIIVFDAGTRDEYTVVISKLDDDELHYLQAGYELRFVR